MGYSVENSGDKKEDSRQKREREKRQRRQNF